MLWFLHNVVELQHGVRGRIDEDVGQRVLVVVHLICKKRQKRPSELLWSLPSSSSIIQYISQEMSPSNHFQPFSGDKGKVTHIQYKTKWYKNLRQIVLGMLFSYKCLLQLLTVTILKIAVTCVSRCIYK